MIFSVIWLVFLVLVFGGMFGMNIMFRNEVLNEFRLFDRVLKVGLLFMLLGVFML